MRLIQAPGIQTTELDRSGYNDTTDNSIVATASFFCGFTDKGIDYRKVSVNSMTTFEQIFGSPTTEAERYLYNGVYETINRGGNAYVAKLPYDNSVLDRFSYSKYKVLSSAIPLSSPYDLIHSISGSVEYSLYDFLLKPNIDIQYSSKLITELEDKDIVTEDMRNILVDSDGVFNLVNYFNKSDITLSIITEMFEYMKDTCNFQYSTVDAVNEIFYKDDTYCRNDAVYMLQDMCENGISTLHSKYGVEEETLETYRDDLCSVVEYIHTNGMGIENMLQNFGKSKNLTSYVSYFYALSTEIDNKGYSGGEIDKQILQQIYRGYEDRTKFTAKHTSLKQLDDTLTSYIQISAYPQEDSGTMEMDDLDRFRTGMTRPRENDIQIVDISRRKYSCEANIVDKDNPKEYLGILPVITTAANAMYVQNMISHEESTFREYCALSDIQNVWSDNLVIDENTSQILGTVNCRLSNLNNDSKDCVGFTQNIGGENLADENQYTVTRTATEMFPTILFENGKIDRKYLKNIGVVVFEMYVDTASDNKIGFSPVEAYTGSLNRKDIDSETKATTFIDTVVNTNSTRINLFSNVKFTENQNVALLDTDKAQTYMIENQTATSLGFYSKDTSKVISLKTSILKGLDRIFFNSKDINTFEFDMLVDCGTSNIAQYIKSVYGDKKGYFDLSDPKSSNFSLNSNDSVKAWKQVLMKYDDLCKNTRKDCMFIADGLRTLCLIGNEKRVRNTKPENTIENTVLKDLKYMSGHINSSYGAGYCDWFYTIDQYTGDYFWCPPSIKANGIYIYTDAYSNYWDAPAGMNRGVLPSDVMDVAFNPTNEEAGKIYNNQWNYAISYPINGIVQEGQKTFQKNKTALDRVNVRRLMLGLEKRVRYVAKYFNYEGLTQYTMTRFNDAVSNILNEAQNRGGIIDYYVICDGRNNTVQTIENNELHCTVAIKPVKSIEFICLNFIATSQGANVQEVAESEM